jgi:protein dithiol oxidoreductase (disulfide-forming)
MTNAPESSAPTAPTAPARPTTGRRTLHRVLATLGVAVAVVGLQAPLGTAATTYTQGKDYVLLDHPVKTSPGEVVEFFWYGCPHSYALQQPLMAWAAQHGVTVKQIPAMWPDVPEEVAYGRLFYALDALGLAQKEAIPVFHAVQDLNEDLTDETTRGIWAQQQGIDPQRLENAWDSDAVQQEVAAASGIRDSYEVDEMPSVVVGGKYRTSPFLAPGGVTGTVPVVDYLYGLSDPQRAAAPVTTKPVMKKPVTKPVAKKPVAKKPTHKKHAPTKHTAKEHAPKKTH